MTRAGSGLPQKPRRPDVKGSHKTSVCGVGCCPGHKDEVFIARRFSGPVRFDGLVLEAGKENHSVSFQTNLPILVTGFEMFTSRTSKVPLEFTLVEGAGIVGRVLAKGKTSLGKSKSKLRPTKKLYLKKPIAVSENSWYSLNVEYLIDDANGAHRPFSIACGSSGERFVTEGGVTFTFMGGLESHESTDVSKGQIPGVLFMQDETTETMVKSTEYEHLRSASAPNRDHLYLIEKQATMCPPFQPHGHKGYSADRDI